MRRFLGLGIVAAALPAPLVGTASANLTSYDGAAGTDVCIEYTCNDRPCVNRTFTAVYTTCQHPFNVACRTVYLGGVTS